MESKYILPGVGFKYLKNIGVIKYVSDDKKYVIALLLKNEETKEEKLRYKNLENNAFLCTEVYSKIEVPCKLRDVKKSSMMYGMRQRKEALQKSVLKITGIGVADDQSLYVNLTTFTLNISVRMDYFDLIIMI